MWADQSITFCNNIWKYWTQNTEKIPIYLYLLCYKTCYQLYFTLHHNNCLNFWIPVLWSVSNDITLLHNCFNNTVLFLCFSLETLSTRHSESTSRARKFNKAYNVNCSKIKAAWCHDLNQWFLYQSYQYTEHDDLGCGTNNYDLQSW